MNYSLNGVNISAVSFGFGIWVTQIYQKGGNNEKMRRNEKRYFYDTVDNLVFVSAKDVAEYFDCSETRAYDAISGRNPFDGHKIIRVNWDDIEYDKLPIYKSIMYKYHIWVYDTTDNKWFYSTYEAAKYLNTTVSKVCHAIRIRDLCNDHFLVRRERAFDNYEEE